AVCELALCEVLHIVVGVLRLDARRDLAQDKARRSRRGNSHTGHVTHAIADKHLGFTKGASELLRSAKGALIDELVNLNVELLSLEAFKGNALALQERVPAKCANTNGALANSKVIGGFHKHESAWWESLDLVDVLAHHSIQEHRESLDYAGILPLII